jgi:hypothetical protein
MRQPYRLLSVGLMVCAVAALAAALYFLHRSHTADVDAEVGKWLLTVAVGLVLTGALSMVVKQIDQRRSERDAWLTVLKDLVAANDTIMLARFRLKAQRSALMYEEQLAEFMRARVELRGIEATGLVIGDQSLREDISAMRNYLDALGSEYETGYLRVSRQQRLDELWLTDRMKAASGGAHVPKLPPPLAKPTGAWGLLTDPKQFPQLARLLDDVFHVDTFRTAYKRAKGCLEIHAGFRGHRSTDASIDSARKLSKRANEFATGRADLPDEATTRIVAEVRNVEDACRARDRRAIERAMVDLAEAVADVISALYVVPERSAAAAEDGPAAARKIEGHPATSPP